MDKMDESLSVFEKVEKLSLSTNNIERIQFLKFKNLQILSLGRNNIKRIQGLEEVSATLTSSASSVFIGVLTTPAKGCKTWTVDA